MAHLLLLDGRGAGLADQLLVQRGQLQRVIRAVGRLAAFPARDARLRDVGAPRDLGLGQPLGAEPSDQLGGGAHAAILYGVA